jgi:endonuclease YncB( thermonuclease family)
MRRWLIYTGAALALLAAAPPARPDVPVRVIDGDTIAAQGVTIRVIGLDAPEMRGQCPAEMRLARIAKARMQQLLAGGARIERRGRDRYGRALAVVRDSRGRDVAQVMIGEGLARPYHGRGRRAGWC